MTTEERDRVLRQTVSRLEPARDPVTEYRVVHRWWEQGGGPEKLSEGGRVYNAERWGDEHYKERSQAEADASLANKRPMFGHYVVIENTFQPRPYTATEREAWRAGYLAGWKAGQVTETRHSPIAKAQDGVAAAVAKLELAEAAVLSASSAKALAKAQAARERAALALAKAEQKLLRAQGT